MILVWMMAAFDCVARLVPILFDLAGPVTNAGWQRERWVRALRRRSETLADFVSEPSAGWHLKQILSKLRNYIHGEALSAGGVVLVVGDHALGSFMAIPETERQTILASLDALGGREAWGVAEPHPGYELHIHPGEFVERLLAYSIQLLNQLMVATPVQRLVPDVPEENLQPGRTPMSVPDQRLLWQLGLLPPTPDR